MGNTDDGGPAFPSIDTRRKAWMETSPTGMSLRDYFAAKAMVVYLDYDIAIGVQVDEDTVADCAYSMADAMLRAREAKPLADEHTHHYLLDVARMMYVCECGAETSTDPGERMRAHLDTFGGK